MVTQHDILECEVKWVFGSITTNKASGGDGIPAELFQILKDYGVNVLHSICHQTWKTQQWPQDWKKSVFIPIPKKGNPLNIQITTQLHSFHMPANLENSAVATGLEKFSVHSNPKEKQCQRMLKLPHNCTHLTH